MFLPALLAVIVAFIFYAAVPVSGAVVVRSQWRHFRRRVARSTTFPVHGQGHAGTVLMAPEADSGPGTDTPAGTGRQVRFMGEAEAIGGLHELWARSDRATCVIDLRAAWVYILTGSGAAERVERRSWQRVQSISPGVRVFAVGMVSLVDGRLMMTSGGRQPPLVILHDGEDSTVVMRAVRSGRHENEYWNPLTQVSLAFGVVLMSGIITLTLPSSRPSLVGAIVLTAAFSPLLPLLPPGVAGFFAYRHFWKAARRCRSLRDVESDRKSPRLNSSQGKLYRMPSSS